ncbi:MAG: primary-amine oxidase [Pseudomonadales bacterium]
MSIHPLSPLTTEEIEQGAALVAAQLGEQASFSSVNLIEPKKAAVLGYQAGDVAERQLRFVGYDHPAEGQRDGGFEGLVNLTTQAVVINRIETGQASIGLADFVAAIQITKADPDWQAAMRLRGVSDFELVQIDPWPTGGYVHPSVPEGHRVHRAISFVKEDPTDNAYARPVQGLIAHVDLTAGKVAYLEDHGVVPLPPEGARYDAANQPKFRDSLRPIDIAQPEGASFQVDGHAVQWEGFNFRVSIHPTNGLVLHQLSYQDGDANRSILYRAALSEMVVPYGDTDPMHNWKHVFDAGEANIGSLTNSLTLGCDCLGEIHYFDHNVVNWNGTARTIENAICMHEEDYGILWKHRDSLTQSTEVRRSRRLVISAVHTVGNYEYGFFWYLYLDGTIQMEVKLTGIIGVSAIVDGGERPDVAPLVAPNVTSPIHQHLFCFRLDFNIDGLENSVYEVEAETVPISEDNPQGTAFRAKTTLLETEQQAQRDCYPQRSRYWKVVNPQKKNGLGKPVAWKLLPSASPTLLADDNSIMAKRAGFAKHNLWVTQFEEGAFNAAGDYPNLNNSGGDGLPKWIEADRQLESTDLVVWHTTGVTHMPRPEDWPVMPVEYCGFSLMPVGFFDRNPTLDVPPSKACGKD